MDIVALRPTVKVDSHKNGNGKRANPRRHVRNGVHVAALRALIGARLYRRGEFKTLAEAAVGVGSNIPYIRAADILIEHDDQHLINRVLFGGYPLLQMAESVDPVVRLVEAYTQASPAGRTAAARKIGVDKIWDTMVVPLTA
jgi:hypothetical protein